MKIVKRMIWFLICWALWPLPAIGDLQESGPDFAGLTCIFLSVATVSLISPFIFWSLESIAVGNGGFQTIFGFLPLTLPIGFSLYLATGIIYHLGIGYGGSTWYRNYKNLINF